MINKNKTKKYNTIFLLFLIFMIVSLFLFKQEEKQISSVLLEKAIISFNQIEQGKQYLNFNITNDKSWKDILEVPIFEVPEDSLGERFRISGETSKEKLLKLIEDLKWGRWDNLDDKMREYGYIISTGIKKEYYEGYQYAGNYSFYIDAILFEEYDICYIRMGNVIKERRGKDLIFLLYKTEDENWEAKYAAKMPMGLSTKDYTFEIISYCSAAEKENYSWDIRDSFEREKQETIEVKEYGDIRFLIMKRRFLNIDNGLEYFCTQWFNLETMEVDLSYANEWEYDSEAKSYVTLYKINGTEENIEFYEEEKNLKVTITVEFEAVNALWKEEKEDLDIHKTKVYEYCYDYSSMRFYLAEKENYFDFYGKIEERFCSIFYEELKEIELNTKQMKSAYEKVKERKENKQENEIEIKARNYIIYENLLLFPLCEIKKDSWSYIGAEKEGENQKILEEIVETVKKNQKIEYKKLKEKDIIYDSYLWKVEDFEEKREPENILDGIEENKSYAQYEKNGNTAYLYTIGKDKTEDKILLFNEWYLDREKRVLKIEKDGYAEETETEFRNKRRLFSYGGVNWLIIQTNKNQESKKIQTIWYNLNTFTVDLLYEAEYDKEGEIENIRVKNEKLEVELLEGVKIEKGILEQDEIEKNNIYKYDFETYRFYCD